MGDTLILGQNLEIGQSLVSANGLFRLTMQADGNIALYGPTVDPSRSGPNATALWSTRTQGADIKRLEVEGTQLTTDNSTVDKVGGKAEWVITGAGGVPIQRLTLRDDGNLVALDLNGNVLWESGTQRTLSDGLPHTWQLILVQPDGADEGLRALVWAYQESMQKSVDMLGTPTNTDPPPDMDGILTQKGIIGPNGSAIGLDAANAKACDLNALALSLREEDRQTVSTVQATSDAGRTTLAAIQTEVRTLNEHLRAAQPPVATDPKSKGKNRFMLTTCDLAVLTTKLIDAGKIIEDKVGALAEQNRTAAQTVTPPPPIVPAVEPADPTVGDDGGETGEKGDDDGAETRGTPTPKPGVYQPDAFHQGYVDGAAAAAAAPVSADASAEPVIAEVAEQPVSEAVSTSVEVAPSVPPAIVSTAAEPVNLEVGPLIRALISALTPATPVAQPAGLPLFLSALPFLGLALPAASAFTAATAGVGPDRAAPRDHRPHGWDTRVNVRPRPRVSAPSAPLDIPIPELTLPDFDRLIRTAR